MTDVTTEATGEGLAMPATDAQQPVNVTQEVEEQPRDLDAPVSLDADVQAQTGGDDAGGDDPANVEIAPAEPEHVEIEFDGKTYNVPAELKDKFMMQADYTKKTQETAVIKKEQEQLREEAAAIFQSSKDFIEANAVMMNLDSQLQQYQSIDWQQLEQADPVAAMSHWRQFQQLQGQRQQVAQYLQNAEGERSAKAEQEIANRLRQTAEFAQREITGWNQQVDEEVTKFATDFGFTAEQLRASMTPQIYKVLHRAMLGEKLLQQQKTAPKPAAQATQPLKTVTAKASPAVAKNPEDMTMDEYVAFRRSQGLSLRG
ncbi:hypothetical protein [Rhizobium rhizogenes]|uniref:hypothetical protein n=1 Tax=Rhizobium rhizogenes TaxID=359 RepID=UPI0022C25123|nr:hypothetical protein [Rhizobium rhizogenes]MCZ7480553.1 hypothetical protein [Rhizobium rhizogenes]